MHPGDDDQGNQPPGRRDDQERPPGRKRDTRKPGVAEQQRDPLEWMQSDGNTATATTAEKGKQMTENNNTTAGAIYGVTAEDLSAHRAKLEADRSEQYQLWLSLPSGSDKEAGERLTQLRALVATWDNMSDAERAEVIADERTTAEAPAEPTEAMRLTEEAQSVANRRPSDRELGDYLSRVTTALIASELGNEQKAEAMSNAEATIRTQGDQIQQLRYAQLEGDDPRLADFWEKAGALAERAGYCDQYDHLAEQLGGPARTVGYNVEHTLTVTVQVTAYSYQSAGKNATSGDFESYENSGYDDDIDERIKEAIDCGAYSIEDSTVENWEESD